MVSVTTLTALSAMVLCIIDTVACRRSIAANSNTFVVQKDYSLRLDLMDYFNNDSMEFTIVEASGMDAQIQPQLVSSYVNATLQGLFGSTASVIATHATSNAVFVLVLGNLTDTLDYFLYKFYLNETNSTSLPYLVKNYTRNTTTPDGGSRFLTLFSMEVIPTNGTFIIDGIFQTLAARAPITAAAFSDVLILGQMQLFDQPDVYINRTIEDTKIVNRSIVFTLISFMSGSLFRTSRRGEGNKMLVIEVLRDTEIFDSTQKWTTVYTWNETNGPLKSQIIYGSDLFLAFQNRIQRINLNPSTLKETKNKNFTAVTNLTMMDVLASDGHVDVYFTVGSGSATLLNINESISRVRWDTFEHPFVLDPLNYTFRVDNVLTANRIIAVSTTVNVSLRRAGDLFNYVSIPWQSGDQTIRISTLTSDGMTVALIEKDRVSMHRLRNSAYLVVSKATNGTVNISAVSKTNTGANAIGRVDLKFIVYDNATDAAYNILDIPTEQSYLNEAIASEQFYNKIVPSSWFVGNFLNMTLTCPSAQAGLYGYRKLGLKKMSFDPRGLSAKNTFYYEFYSELVSGSFIMVFQLELKIFVHRCVLSQTNELWCRVIKKINETDLIVEGTIFKGQYFMYLTTRGYTMYDVLNPKSTEIRIMSSQGTCKYLYFLNFDLLACSNTFNKTLEFKSIQPDGKLRSLYTRPNVFSTQIDYPPGSQIVILSGEYTIDVVSIRTSETVAQITSNVTRRADKVFKVCGKYMILYSATLNVVEQYDISDPTRVIRIQDGFNLDQYKLKIIDSFRVKFEKGCQNSWPLVVTDGLSVFAIFVNIGAPSNDILDTKVFIGKFNYLANYFVSALNLMQSSTAPRVIWSFLDTSEASADTFFGFEIELYKDFMLEVDLRNIEKSLKDTKSIDCTLSVRSRQPSTSPTAQPPFEVPFTLRYTQNSVDIRVASTNTSSANKSFVLSMLESVSKLNVSSEFTGQVISYIYTSKSDDFNKSIKLYEMLNRDDQFSKLIKCSRENTLIRDFVVSKSKSFHLLTTEAVYKIKNATDYYVQNYMMFTNSASEGSTYSCYKIMLNEDNNLMVNLCDQDTVPFFVVSNWNSLKPGIILQKQIANFKEIGQIRYSFSGDNDFYLFSNTMTVNLKRSTLYQKYRLQSTETGIDIQLMKTFTFPYEFLHVSTFSLPLSKAANGKDSNDYFIGVTGSNAVIEDMYINIYIDVNGNHDIVQIGNFSLKTTLSKQFQDFFAPIIAMDCTYLKYVVNNATNYLASCLLIQERNIHYIVNFTITDGTKVQIGLRNIFMNYGNQVPAGPAEFNEQFMSLVSVRPSATSDTYPTATNLTKIYLLVYDMNLTLPPNLDSITDPYKYVSKIVSGMPLPSIMADTKQTKLKIITIDDIVYLFVIGKTYYPFQTFRIEKKYQIEVLKNIQSSNMNVIAVNHYSRAEVNFTVVDKFVRILIIAAIVLGVIILGFFTFSFFKNRRRAKQSTMAGMIGTFVNEELTMSDLNSDDPNQDLVDPKRSEFGSRIRKSILGHAQSTDGRVQEVHHNDVAPQDQPIVDGPKSEVKAVSEPVEEEGILSSDEEDLKPSKITSSLTNPLNVNFIARNRINSETPQENSSISGSKTDVPKVDEKV